MTMHETHVLTIKEVSMLSKGNVDSLENSIETLIRRKVLPSEKRKLSWAHREKRVLHPRSLYFLFLHEKLRSLSLSTDVQKNVATWLINSSSRAALAGKFVLQPGVEVCLNAFRDELTDIRLRALHYILKRNRCIHSVPEIRGGEPVIRGTRLSVYSLFERYESGDTVDDLAEDYPNVDIDTLETAIMYARANPRSGRPVEKPWRAHAEAVH